MAVCATAVHSYGMLRNWVSHFSAFLLFIPLGHYRSNWTFSWKIIYESNVHCVVIKMGHNYERMYLVIWVVHYQSLSNAII